MFFFLITLGFVFAQEVKYQEVPDAPTPTVRGGLPNYVKYIYNFAMVFAGLLALLVLMWSGVQYLTSAGKPEVLKSAKSRIKSAFLGILILLFSYLILITINPQLIIFQLPGIIKAPSPPLPETPISPLITSDLLGRIKEMAEVIKKIPDEIKNSAEKIQELTNKCDCKNTLPLCICTGGSSGSECKPRRCYAAPDAHHPCPEFKEIKNNQERIVVWRDEILYYRNRASAEAEDLKDNIEKLLNVKISWYDEKIAAEEEVLKQVEGESAKALQQRLIDYLEEERDWLIEERDYKENLKQKLIKLAETIAKVEEPVNKISKLPDECLESQTGYGINNKCQAHCKGKCHDFKDGCQPDKCDGGNPCPTDEIKNQVEEINPLPQEIIRISDEIVAIIDNIKETQVRKIQL